MQTKERERESESDLFGKKRQRHKHTSLHILFTTADCQIVSQYVRHGLNDALCGIYPEKLAKKAKTNLKPFKLRTLFDRQQNSALYNEFSRL